MVDQPHVSTHYPHSRVSPFYVIRSLRFTSITTTTTEPPPQIGYCYDNLKLSRSPCLNHDTCCRLKWALISIVVVQSWLVTLPNYDCYSGRLWRTKVHPCRPLLWQGQVRTTTKDNYPGSTNGSDFVQPSDNKHNCCVSAIAMGEPGSANGILLRLSLQIHCLYLLGRPSALVEAVYSTASVIVTKHGVFSRSHGEFLGWACSSCTYSSKPLTIGSIHSSVFCVSSRYKESEEVRMTILNKNPVFYLSCGSHVPWGRS